MNKRWQGSHRMYARSVKDTTDQPTADGCGVLAGPARRRRNLLTLGKRFIILVPIAMKQRAAGTCLRGTPMRETFCARRSARTAAARHAHARDSLPETLQRETLMRETHALARYAPARDAL